MRIPVQTPVQIPVQETVQQTGAQAENTGNLGRVPQAAAPEAAPTPAQAPNQLPRNPRKLPNTLEQARRYMEPLPISPACLLEGYFHCGEGNAQEPALSSASVSVYGSYQRCDVAVSPECMH